MKSAYTLGVAVMFVIAFISLPRVAKWSHVGRVSAAGQANIPPVVVSPEAPYVVPAPQAEHPPFDWFSWENFIALNWPAATNPSTGLLVRGQADVSKHVGDPGPRVWETYKADWEAFGTGKITPSPTAWGSWDVSGGMNPCGAADITKLSTTLTMITKMDSVINGFTQASQAGPLIDSNGNYVRYEMRMNQAEYETIVNNNWYIADNLPPMVQFPSSTSNPNQYGALEIKAAWRELIPGVDERSRYYSVNAKIVDPGSPPTCRNAVMGLIGFHMAIKTAPFMEWVWATFEQEDNVPDGGIVAGTHYSLNNGTASPPTDENGFNFPPNGVNAQTKGPSPPPTDQPLAKLPPVQVTRFTPIDNNIQAANQLFHQQLAGTWLAHYNLVADQWPRNNPTPPDPRKPYPEGSGMPFPNDHVANTSAETYFQNEVPNKLLGNSCMSCHFRAAVTDFSWMLLEEARPAPLTGAQRAMIRTLPAARLKQAKDRAEALNLLRRSMREVFPEAPNRSK